jgi:hypothetical protein
MNAVFRQSRHYLPASIRQLAILAIGAVMLGWVPMAAAEDEVECTSIRLEMASEGYDMTCGVENITDVTVETLEANSVDGTHFLVVTDFRTNYGYIFESRGLRQGLTTIFNDLELKDWQSGKGQQGLTTSEFSSHYKTVPSQCVGFQRYTSRDQWGGWRRHIIGFGCSRVGDKSQVYEAMKRVDFPD